MMDVGHWTDTGKRRQINEDYYLIDDEHGIYIVCDGVGGHRAGDVASKVGATSMRRELSRSLAALETIDDTAFDHVIRRLLHEALQEANDSICDLASNSVKLYDMGTTVVLALVARGKIYIAHVGDSRALLLRDDRIVPLTEDHSLVHCMVMRGEIKPEEAAKHPLRNVIMRSLGRRTVIEEDITYISLKKGDYYLLCTDGLTEMLSPEEIKAIIMAAVRPDAACKRLIEAANERGGYDNATVVLLHYALAGGM